MYDMDNDEEIIDKEPVFHATKEQADNFDMQNPNP